MIGPFYLIDRSRIEKNLRQEFEKFIQSIDLPTKIPCHVWVSERKKMTYGANGLFYKFTNKYVIIIAVEVFELKEIKPAFLTERRLFDQAGLNVSKYSPWIYTVLHEAAHAIIDEYNIKQTYLGKPRKKIVHGDQHALIVVILFKIFAEKTKPNVEEFLSYLKDIWNKAGYTVDEEFFTLIKTIVKYLLKREAL